MGNFIGIDLGTTYSAVSTIDETGRPVIIHNDDGDNITASCVCEKADNEMEVGEFARRQWGNKPESAAARFKRDMGTSAKYSINGQEFTPTELSAFVLKKLKQCAEKKLGSPVSEAVVTIPANFADEARNATMAAAKAADLNVNYIINEPTAAALFYAFKEGTQLNGNYAVYDLGGGTFDISIIHVTGQEVEVRATNGVHKLGGDDFDIEIQKIVREKYQELSGENLEEHDFTRNDSEEQKKDLSKARSVMVRVAGKNLTITREEFEEAISPLIAQTEMLCEATAEEAGLQLKDLSGVFLVGGSTRVPMVKDSVKKIFEQEPIGTANVDEIVALGAALYAAYKGNPENLSVVQKTAIEKMQITEITGKYYGTTVLDQDSKRGSRELVNTVVIEKGEKIPVSVTEMFYTVHEGQTAVSCDVTESSAKETNPRFVNVIWEGKLGPLPEGRPEGQEIEVVFSYDVNQMMQCSFTDVASGLKQKVELHPAEAKKSSESLVEKFTVE